MTNDYKVYVYDNHAESWDYYMSYSYKHLAIEKAKELYRNGAYNTKVTDHDGNQIDKPEMYKFKE